MIAAWMLYCLGIGLAFVVVGYALERGLHFAGRPTRWAWVVALLGSYLFPAAAWLRPEAFASFPTPLPIVAESTPGSSSFTTSRVVDQPRSRPLSLADLDLPLRWGWAGASIALLLTLAVAASRLVSLRRRWRHATVDGRLVLLSHNVGPAVVGVWSPQVVLPEWALELPALDRELMLAHEEQHLRAADPAVTAAGFVLVLLAPWNLALWWQWRRLRLAVEMDCDARVLSQGRSAATYGELLLAVSRRRSPRLIGAAAFGEPASFLESRIRRMLSGMPRWRWAGVAVAALVAVGAVMGACETPRPLGPARDPLNAGGALSVGITGFVSSVIAPADIDQAPVIVSGATANFPNLPRLAGIEGRVVLRASVEADGRVGPGSIAVVESPHPALAAAARSAVLSSRFRPAMARGRAVGAVVHVVYDFLIGSSPIEQRTRRVNDRLALQQAERLRPWVESNARRLFPSILEASGPPGDAFLIHDSRRQVYRSAHTELHYLGEARPNSEIDVTALKQALPSFNLGHDAWGVVDPRALRGLVRDNVRVIWIHHDPAPQDTAVTPAIQQYLRDQTGDIKRRGELVSRLARQYHPDMFGQGGSQIAIALVLDSKEQVVAHAAHSGESGANDGVYQGVSASGESCLNTLTRLLPTYRNAHWSQSGCTFERPNVIIYWGVPLLPLTR